MTSASRKAAGWCAAGAEWLMPPAKATWARAMAAETDHLTSDGAALHFAIGCVWAACTERARAIGSAPWAQPGAAVGALLVAHASVAGSGTWPLLWPLLGGMAAVLATEGRAPAMSFRAAVAIASKAGASGGLLLFLAASAFVLSGAAVDGPGGESLLVRVAIGGAVAALLATIGGIAVAPLVCAAVDDRSTMPAKDD